jgi:hypothetical protein
LYEINNNSYIPTVEVFYVGLACAGVAVGCVLNYLDFKQGGNLNTPG